MNHKQGVSKMKKIVFCNIAWMKNYCGITEEDKPQNGGSYVEENGEGAESCNFLPYNHNCLGYVAYNGQNLNLSRIEGKKISSAVSAIDNVLVVWVANRKIVGWYENSKMYRQMQEFYDDMLGEDKDWWGYNFKASEKNVYLIPVELRNFDVPSAPTAGTGKGMGQSNIWYADSEYARENFVPTVFNYLDKIRDKCIRPFIYTEKLTKIAKPLNLTNEQLFEKACNLSDSGNYLEAIEIFNLLKTKVKIPAELCRVKYLHGWTLSRMLLYDEAIELYKQCLHDFGFLEDDELPDDFLELDCMWDLANLYAKTRQFYLSSSLYNRLFEVEEGVEQKCNALISLMWLSAEENDYQRLREIISRYDDLNTDFRANDVQYYRELVECNF